MKKKQGVLHNDTAYGIVDGPGNKDRYQVVVRKPLEAIKSLKDIEAVRDSAIKAKLQDVYQEEGIDAVHGYLKSKNIRRLRMLQSLSIIPINDSNGKPYKAFKGDNNWAMEVFEMPENTEKAGTWEGFMISRFEVNQKHFKPGQTKRPHPASKLVMRLQINDCLSFVPEGESLPKIFRIQKLSGNQIVLAESNEANTDGRNRDPKEQFKLFSKSPNALKILGVKKAHISPSGRVSFS